MLLLCVASMFALEFVLFFSRIELLMELSEELDSTLHGFKMTAAGSLHFDVPAAFRWDSLEQDACLFFLV